MEVTDVDAILIGTPLRPMEVPSGLTPAVGNTESSGSMLRMLTRIDSIDAP